jgi:hypothetical protein
MDKFEEAVSKFEKAGELEIREQVAGKYIVDKQKAFAEEWFRRLDQEREDARALLRDEREERTLAIAEEANAIASRALAISEEQTSAAARAARAAERQSRYAMYAAIIAATALIVSNKDSISNVLGLE